MGSSGLNWLRAAAWSVFALDLVILAQTGYAALDERIKTGVAVACLTRYENLIQHEQLKAHGIYYFVPGLLAHFDTEAIVSLIAPRPVLFQTGDQDSGSPVIGVEDLAWFGAHVFAGKPLKLSAKPARVSAPRLVRAQWPVLERPLTLVTGKGGVGKTTIASALAFHTRRQDEGPITICSVDPAPSLDDISMFYRGQETLIQCQIWKRQNVVSTSWPLSRSRAQTRLCAGHS